MKKSANPDLPKFNLPKTLLSKPLEKHKVTQLSEK